MIPQDLEFAFAKAADAAPVEALLAECGLPHEDVSDQIFNFVLAKRDGQTIGVVGLEVVGDVGLLRSLAVAEPHRRFGIGKKLCALMEAYASLMGLKALYLTTVSAEGYFQRLGYRIVERGEVPQSLESTKEFSVYCRAEALCMVKEISSLSEESPESSS